jgi:carbon-monoxide dehydrogenase large subunit
MPNQALSLGYGCIIWIRHGKIAKKSAFQVLSMQDHTSPSSLENAIALQKYGVGQPVRRKEDDTLVRGKGKYTDDFNLPGQAYAWIVRSSHAHGIIRGIDVSDAKAMPGVLGVWTGTDLAGQLRPFTCGLPLKSRDGSPLLQTNRMPLVTDKVRYVGDAVAFVVAETLAQARDAGEAVVLDIDPLPAVTSAEEAASPARRSSTITSPTMSRSTITMATAAKVDAAFAAAAHVTRLDIVNTRVAVVAMEPRAALASYDKASERFTIQVPTQGVAGNRVNLAKNMKVPNEKVRILTANVGGSFGMKNINYPEYICILHAAKVLGKPGEVDRRAIDQLSVRQPRPRAEDSLRAGARRRRQVPRGQALRLRQSRRLHHRRRAQVRCRSTPARTSPASIGRR